METRLDKHGNFVGTASGREAVLGQIEILLAITRHALILRLGLYALAAIFVVVSAILVVFAPAGRQVETTLVAIALLAVAAGAAGFGTFAIKTPVAAVEAGAEALHEFDERSDAIRGRPKMM